MTHATEEKLLKALIDIGKELAATVDLDELLQRLLQIAREVFAFENAIIRLYDPESRQLSTAASYGYPESAIRIPLQLGQGIMGKVAVTRMPLLIADLAAAADYVPGIEGARSELAVPMLVGERLIGVFNLESPRPNAFSPADIAPLLTVAGQAAIAIENARLYGSLRAVSARFEQLHHLNDSILNSASIGIYAVDDQLVVTSWNRRMEELSGLDENAALGRKLLALFPLLEEEGFGERLRRVLISGCPEQLRFTHRNFRGETRFQNRRLTPLLEQGTTVGVVVLVEDVTEFRQLLEQLGQSEKLAEIGRLSAALAHEVNNPLAVILYAAQLLLREEEQSEFQRDLATRIAGEAERLKALTGSMLSFSRAGNSVRRLTDLNELLADVLRLIDYEFKRKGLGLETDFGPLPLVEVDPNRLKQVFINLAMNAQQALATGNLRVATAELADGTIQVAFVDNGPGISVELRERIFEPFFSTKREGEGTGLGLYICRSIIEEHQGLLTVAATPGGGASFLVHLPQVALTKAESLPIENA
jgi:PAS domain S-box-containing protein